MLQCFLTDGIVLYNVGQEIVLVNKTKMSVHCYIDW